MRKSIVSMTVVVGLLLSGTALAQPRTDLEIINDVSRQVQRYVYFTIFDDVSASLDRGVVTLNGKVTMSFKAKGIEEAVEKVDGVTRVVNHLEVLPASLSDDRLRYRLARAIYGNSAFWPYAAMANPPIHIVVERGHVTLTGVVNSDVERVLARSILTSFNTFTVTNELKTTSEMQALMETLS
jgi:osmotically-inducible protein OsmY